MTTSLTALLTSFDPEDHPGRIIERIMAAARDHLALDVSFVAEFDGGQRIFRFAGGDLQRYHVNVAGAEPLEQTYCQRIVAGALGPIVHDAARDPIAAALPVTQELGIGAYIGVPVQFSDGRVYGTLCCLSGSASPELSERDVLFMRMAAAIVGEQLEREGVERDARTTIFRRIRSTIDNRTFHIVYQPIVALESGDVLGYEALSRFAPDSTVATVDTQGWFDHAWFVGLGPQLEMAAVELALEGLDAIPAPCYLAVNLSPETLLADGVIDLFTTYPCDRLVIEVTEHERVLNYAPVRGRLDHLRSMGARIAIDDVGTGHAGINHLLEFRPDILKIDLSVVQGVRRDRMRRAIAATFATLGASLGIQLVAEGIETPEDQEALEILGLTAGQGFLIGRPTRLPLPAPATPAGGVRDPA